MSWAILKLRWEDKLLLCAKSDQAVSKLSIHQR
jgi:hypothetical protein